MYTLLTSSHDGQLSLVAIDTSGHGRGSDGATVSSEPPWLKLNRFGFSGVLTGYYCGELCICVRKYLCVYF